MSFVETIIVREGIFGFSILLTSVRIVSVPKNSLSTEKEVMAGAVANASETLSKPATSAVFGTVTFKSFNALHTPLATKSLQHIKHSGRDLCLRISVFYASGLP